MKSLVKPDPDKKRSVITPEERNAFTQLGDFIVELDIGFAKAVKLAFFIAHTFNIVVRKDAKK